MSQRVRMLCTITAALGMPAMSVGQTWTERWACDATVQMQADGEGSDDHFGFSVASGGDWDGDGRDDLLVCGGIDPAEPADAWMYWGLPGSDGLPQNSVKFTGLTRGPSNSDRWGPTVSFLEDINGDGLDDVALGDPLWRDSGDTVDRGRVCIFLSDDGLVVDGAEVSVDLATVIIANDATDDPLTPNNNETALQFGWSVTSAEVLAIPGESSALADIVVGAPGDHEEFPSYSGAVYVIGGATTIGGQISASSADLTWSGVAGRDRFGHSVAGLGDLAGDAFHEILIGAPQAAG